MPPPPPPNVLTPLLALDLEAFERNAARMSDAVVRRAGKRWRPHVKGLRAGEAAQALLAAGAYGVTCSTLDEAHTMVDAGVGDVLLANELAQPAACDWLAELNRRARVVCAVDAPEHLGLLEAAARHAGLRLPVVVEVDVGMGRCGCTPGEPTLALARAVAASPALTFEGLCTWEGHTVRIREPEAKAAAVTRSLGLLVDTARACAQTGLPAAIVSAGGTGDFLQACGVEGVTELQAGGGAYGDLRYASEFGAPLEPALTLWTTVVSRPTPTRIVCDGGFKAVAAQPAPAPLGLPGVREVRLNASHTIVELDSALQTPAIGAALAFDVGNADATVFLHRRLHLHRGGRWAGAWALGLENGPMPRP
jgi:D-serine deaminase-like pyridoxal phosphate-dependent protein